MLLTPQPASVAASRSAATSAAARLRPWRSMLCLLTVGEGFGLARVQLGMDYGERQGPPPGFCPRMATGILALRARLRQRLRAQQGWRLGLLVLVRLQRGLYRTHDGL